MYATLYEPNKDGKEFQYPEPAKDEGKFTTRNVYKLINVKGQREQYSLVHMQTRKKIRFLNTENVSFTPSPLHKGFW